MKWQNNNMPWNILLRSACHCSSENRTHTYSSFFPKIQAAMTATGQPVLKITFFAYFESKSWISTLVSLRGNTKSLNFPCNSTVMFNWNFRTSFILMMITNELWFFRHFWITCCTWRTCRKTSFLFHLSFLLIMILIKPMCLLSIC